MSNDAVDITQGSGTHIATRKFTEGGVDKHAQRMNLDDPTGAIVPFPATLGPGLGFKVEFAAGGTAFAVTIAALADLVAGEWETVAASQTDQVLGATGGAGDYLLALTVVPTTTSPGGPITIKDGAGSAITVFAGGPSSLSNLVTFDIMLGLKSLTGAWKVTTPSGLSVIAKGNFQ